MFSLFDGQWDIFKGRIADIKIKQLAKERERLEKKYGEYYNECEENNEEEIDNDRNVE